MRSEWLRCIIHVISNFMADERPGTAPPVLHSGLARSPLLMNLLVGRAQLYRLSLVAYCCPEPVHGKKIWQYSLFFVMALCYVQKCELLYNWAWCKTAAHRGKKRLCLGHITRRDASQQNCFVKSSLTRDHITRRDQTQQNCFVKLRFKSDHISRRDVIILKTIQMFRTSKKLDKTVSLSWDES